MDTTIITIIVMAIAIFILVPLLEPLGTKLGTKIRAITFRTPGVQFPLPDWGTNAEPPRDPPIAIYGAGHVGRNLLRCIRDEEKTLPSSRGVTFRELAPKCFIDDDQALWGKEIEQLRVAGSLEDLENIVTNYGIKAVVVAIADIDKEKLMETIRQCDSVNVKCYRFGYSIKDYSKCIKALSGNQPYSRAQVDHAGV